MKERMCVMIQAVSKQTVSQSSFQLSCKIKSGAMTHFQEIYMFYV